LSSLLVFPHPAILYRRAGERRSVSPWFGASEFAGRVRGRGRQRRRWRTGRSLPIWSRRTTS